MSVIPNWEDGVTMAANAAVRLLERTGTNPDEIGQLVVSTESGVDHSKPVASFVQKGLEAEQYAVDVAQDGDEAQFMVGQFEYDVAVLDLRTFAVSWLRGVGRSPRTVLIDSAGRYLYATLNGEGSVAKVDVGAGRLVRKAATGSAPRSMAITPDGSALYVTNYASDTMSKITTADMRVVATVPTQHHPIGITFDPVTRRVWVACYSGSIMVFQD